MLDGAGEDYLGQVRWQYVKIAVGGAVAVAEPLAVCEKAVGGAVAGASGVDYVRIMIMCNSSIIIIR